MYLMSLNMIPILISNETSIHFKSHTGDTIDFEYNSKGLRAQGSINNQSIDYDHWTNNNVIESPYLTVNEDGFYFSDGEDSFIIDVKDKPFTYFKS